MPYASPPGVVSAYLTSKHSKLTPSLLSLHGKINLVNHTLECHLHPHIPKILILGTLITSLASAASFSFQGSLTKDDDVQFFTFSVNSPSTVTLVTRSYAGGTNAAGTVVSSGGFDPVLALFTSTSQFITQVDEGGSNVPPDPATGFRSDVYLQSNFSAGAYIVSLMEYDNFAYTDFNQGFYNAGEGNFTSIFGCSHQQFCDAYGNNRTGTWALDIIGANSANIVSTAPEPGVGALAVIGLVAIGAIRCRRPTEA